MTTTEPTTTVPSWINLEAVVPPELRQEVEDMSAAMRAFIDQARPLADRYVDVLHRFDQVVSAAAQEAADALELGTRRAPSGEDVQASAGLVLNRLTGCEALYDLGTEVQHMFDQDRLYGASEADE